MYQENLDNSVSLVLLYSALHIAASRVESENELMVEALHINSAVLQMPMSELDDMKILR